MLWSDGGSAFQVSGFKFRRQFVPDLGGGDGERFFTELWLRPRNHVVTGGRRAQSSERWHVCASCQHVGHVERCTTSGHIVNEHAQFVIDTLLY